MPDESTRPPTVGRMNLAYLVFDVRRLNAWTHFASAMLGLAPAESSSEDGMGYRLDRATQRLVFRPGKADDIAAIGIELENEAALERLRLRLGVAGVRIEAVDGPTARARQVSRLLAFRDPEGLLIEAVVGLQDSSRPFESPLFPDGFHSDDTGFGHAALAARDMGCMERFYVHTLGFAVTERVTARVGPLNVRGVFLHCNRRHHSMAILNVPQRRRLNHFMLHARSIADVVRAYDRAKALRVPLSLDLGQHASPDGTVSFYGRTPSGFDFEIGAGGREIRPEGWQELTQSRMGMWGHRPTLGRRLRAASDVIATQLFPARG